VTRALVLVILSGLAACGSDARSTGADPAPSPTPAERAPTEASQDRQRVEQLQRDLAAFDARLAAATNAVVDATTDAERADAKARLELVRRDRGQVEKQLAQARRAWCVSEPNGSGC